MSGDQGVPGVSTIPGVYRKESMMRSQKKKSLKMEDHGSLKRTFSVSRTGPTMNRAPSMSINRGALTSELWRYAASVENKVNIQIKSAKVH